MNVINKRSRPTFPIDGSVIIKVLKITLRTSALESKRSILPSLNILKIEVYFPHDANFKLYERRVRIMMRKSNTL